MVLIDTGLITKLVIVLKARFGEPFSLKKTGAQHVIRSGFYNADYHRMSSSYLLSMIVSPLIISIR